MTGSDESMIVPLSFEDSESIKWETPNYCGPLSYELLLVLKKPAEA